MNQQQERRHESRFRYHWPVWFSPEPHYGDVAQGQMVDITSRAAAFTCYADHQCPYPSQHLATRFSVPRYEMDGSFDMADFVRTGHVHRVDSLSDHLRRIVIHFHDPLPFCPGEQDEVALAPEVGEPMLV